MPDIATAALIRKRAELAGEIEARAAAHGQLRAGLAHLDAAIRIRCPEAEPELIRPSKPSRKGCDCLDDRSCPAHPWVAEGRKTAPVVHQIARAVMACKGLDAADHTALQHIAGMVK